MTDKKIIKEWLDQADSDLAFAESNLKMNDRFFSQICFHFQQSAEKYLKAFLIAKGHKLRKIHNLGILLDECITINKNFEKIRGECLFLNPFYIATRYPVFWPINGSKKEAEQALQATKSIERVVKKLIE
jgi:HEPN domain-containing protein